MVAGTDPVIPTDSGQPYTARISFSYDELMWDSNPLTPGVIQLNIPGANFSGCTPQLIRFQQLPVGVGASSIDNLVVKSFGFTVTNDIVVDALGNRNARTGVSNLMLLSDILQETPCWLKALATGQHMDGVELAVFTEDNLLTPAMRYQLSGAIPVGFTLISRSNATFDLQLDLAFSTLNIVTQ